MHKSLALLGARAGFVWLLIGVGALAAGCAYAPAFRPVGPPMDDRVVEVGAGGIGLFAQDAAGVGATGWVTGRIAPDVLLVGRGHVADAVPYASGGLLGDERSRQWGGAAGLRGLFPLRPGLLAGGELVLDYTQLTSTTAAGLATQQHYASLIASVPIAEEAFRDGYVYVQPALGAGYRFGDVDVPFGGFFELPFGFAWRAQPGLVVLAEGGLSIPFSGGYVAAGAAFRF
jgi:hypothetical protein